jgi:hypothetical protein
MTGWLKSETQPAFTSVVQGKTLTPFIQSVSIHIPGVPAALIWKRPVSILLSNSQGEETVLPVPDITRQIILGMLGGSLMFWLLTKIMLRKHR